MKCVSCKNRILQKSGKRTMLRIQGAVVFEDGVCKSKCFWCGADVEIPIEIKEGTPLVGERFILTQTQQEIQ